MSILTPDNRLPYVVTSSVNYRADTIRILRSTTKGSIASGAEEYDAPIIDINIREFADKSFDAVLIITPDQATTKAIITAVGRSSMSCADFEVLVHETARELKADEREIDPLGTREVVDAASSAYATAQRVYNVLCRQMPRVQAAVAADRSRDSGSVTMSHEATS